MKKTKYKRILFKLSGEAFKQGGQAISPELCVWFAREIRAIRELDVSVAVVVGGGNIFRGFKESKDFEMDRSVADYMGMLATVLNGLALQDALEKQKMPTRVLTAIQMHQIAESYIRRRAIRHLEKGRIVIFVAGTGNPYFTTDTAAVLRAVEIKADVIFKGTKVDGVYNADPLKDKKAKKYKTISYLEVLDKGLKIMDSTAVSLCMDNKIPVVVFDAFKKGNLKKAIMGRAIGTVIN